MPQPYGSLLNRGQHVIITGIPGSGKSTLARMLVRDARRVVFFDPNGDYADLPGAVVVTPTQLAQEHFKEKYVRLVVLAAKDPDFDISEEFVHVERHCRLGAQSYGGVVLVADEVHMYKAGRAIRALEALHMNGHKDGIVTVLVSQRAVGIPLGCRATATDFISLIQVDPTDLEALEEKCGPEFAAQVAAWRPGKPPVRWSQPELWPRYC